jgi:uncharacterized cupredoxin-like copper-binding protein
MPRGLVVVSIALLVGACQRQQEPTAPPADEAMALNVTAMEYTYEPAELSVPAGVPVAISISNKGSLAHSMEVELPEEAGGEQELEEPIEPGSTAELFFTAPAEPGEYEIYCPVPGHKDQGMIATLVVTQ